MQIHNNTLIAECSAYDFKEMLERKKVKSWLKSVSAFANTDGGSLFYGVNDDGVIVGLENPQADADFISEMIKARLDPVPEVQLIPIEHEGHTLLEVKVKAGTLTPYYYYQDGTRTAYVRVGNESVECNSQQLLSLVLKGTHMTWDSLPTQVDASKHSFIILANTFREQTHQEWNDKYLESFGLVTSDGKLIVSFPKADTISNGQRDIITFITSLVKFRMNYNNEKKQILIIDEVFDYLDDANVVAAQYFLSDFLSENREDFYLIILSHITEEHFRGWVLKKKLNTQYIKPTQAKASINTKAFIAFRDSLKKTNEANYSALSNYYFHYNPKTNEQDLSAIYQAKDGLKKNWFEGTNLHSDILPELNKYLKGQESYDPYAVCFALRYACEKNIYAQLRNDEERTIFLSKKKTKDKLEWAEDAGYDVPVIYYMLGIIFNEAEHITGIEIAQNKERSCVYRLDNGAIRQMIIELFNYTEEDIAIDAII